MNKRRRWIRPWIESWLWSKPPSANWNYANSKTSWSTGRQGYGKEGKRILGSIRIKKVRKRARCCRIKVSGGERRAIMAQLRQSITDAGWMVILTTTSRGLHSGLLPASLNFWEVKENESDFTKYVSRCDPQVSRSLPPEAEARLNSV
jgi:hypothetical protein